MTITLTALHGIPLIHEGNDLAATTLRSFPETGTSLEDGDILVLSSKIVSKAEGRMVDLATIVPGSEAKDLAEDTGKDPRLVQLMLEESRAVIRARLGTIIIEHKLGFVCANAGIDHSNVTNHGKVSGEFVLLLPRDPDRSAAQIRAELEKASGKQLGVMIIDSHGRAWRLGTVGTCIGLSGIPALIDERGWTDLSGYTLRTTIVGVADELASAASLLMGQAAEGTPIIHVRGFPYSLCEGSAKEVLRPRELDLFR